MRLFEIHAVESTWWVAAEDEGEVLTYLRDEMNNLEISEEEIDEALEEPDIVELTKDYAKLIDIVDEFCDSLYTVWDLYVRHGGAGVVHSDFIEEREDLATLNWDADDCWERRIDYDWASWEKEDDWELE